MQELNAIEVPGFFYCPGLGEVTHFHIPEGVLSRMLRERKRERERWKSNKNESPSTAGAVSRSFAYTSGVAFQVVGSLQ